MNSKLLQEFYEKYSREIYLYVYSLGHDSFLAEDLLQDPFVKALLSLHDSMEFSGPRCIWWQVICI